MASLLPLLHDLLPMIMPSEVHISHDRDLTPIFERAEGPPYHQSQAGSPAREHKRQVVSGAGSDQGKSCEPIQLLDREENSAGQPTPGLISAPCQPAPRAQASGPRVFRKDAMLGVSDKMCATGTPMPLALRPRPGTVLSPGPANSLCGSFFGAIPCILRS